MDKDPDTNIVKFGPSGGKIPTSSGAPPLTLPGWLETWTANDTLPHTARAEAEAALGQARATVVPAGPEVAAVAIAQLVEFLNTFGVVSLPADGSARETAIRRLVTSYMEQLQDLPADLLIQAVNDTRRNHTFHTAPLPGEIRKRVADDLARRRADIAKLEVALKFGRYERPPVPPEERATPEQLARFREMRAGIGTKLRLAPEYRIVDDRGGEDGGGAA